MAISSAAGIISLLDEPHVKLKCAGLQKMNSIVNSYWMEMAEVLPKLESLFEDTSFPDKKLAALVASKVYFHLGAYQDSLIFALGAEELFDVSKHSEYIDTIIGKGIDFYTKQRIQLSEGKSNDKIDERLERIVNRMFERCFTHKKYRQAIGIALEARRLDIVERVIKESGDKAPDLLAYIVKVSLSFISSRMYRSQVLLKVVELYSSLPDSDYVNMCQCLVFLEDHAAVAKILDNLVKSENNKKVTLALQIAFDLYDSATQQFLTKVLKALTPAPPAATASTSSTSKDAGGSMTGTEAASTTSAASTTASASGPTFSQSTDSVTGSTTTTIKESTTAAESVSSPMDTETTQPPGTETVGETEGIGSEGTGTGTAGSSSSSSDDDETANRKLLKRILSGDETIRLHLQFLIRNNHTDMLIMKNIRDTTRHSVAHTAAVIANGFMHVSTTCDDFLRENLEWLRKATNWSKFSAVASLGVIHKGHESDANKVMEIYLPKAQGSASGSTGYMEGGGLYALGMIYANHGDEKVIKYLKDELSQATQENVRSGACLGLGLAAMGSHRADVYEALKDKLMQDEAVTGESAGLAMGLVMLGSSSHEAIKDMVAYAQETQHEKILRGLCVGIALLMYGRLEEAEPLIDTLLQDKDGLLRRSGVYCIALAYCGTGQKEALQKLLHLAVSDVNDDVRRAAVTALGFLLLKSPEQCPQIVSLLSESYNPHVRYGAALALGISCAGTASKEAIALLEPMKSDTVNYVRQGVLIAMALIMVQHNEVTCPKVKDFRAHLMKVISDKHEDIIAKFGATISCGILDAGGRNMTVSMLSRSGQVDLQGVVGMLVFFQHWYWFPLTHFLALSFTPTCLIALNPSLKVPVMEFESKARPSLYAYTPPLEDKKEVKAEKVETVVLSTTAKAKKRERQKQGISATSSDSKEKQEKMETDEEEKKAAEEKEKEKEKEKKAEETDKEKGEKKEGEKEKEKEKAKEPEPNFEMLSNPARVMKQQLKVMHLPAGSRFEPVKSIQIGGIIMVNDKRPTENLEFVEAIQTRSEKTVDEEKEPEPPEPFEFLGE